MLFFATNPGANLPAGFDPEREAFFSLNELENDRGRGAVRRTAFDSAKQEF